MKVFKKNHIFQSYNPPHYLNFGLLGLIRGSIGMKCWTPYTTTQPEFRPIGAIRFLHSENS